MKQTVLITGVAGFLGRYAARHFAKQGWTVIGFDEVPPENVRMADVKYVRSQLPGAALEEALRTLAPGACVHCAGRASVGLSMEQPSADFHGNTLLVCEILDALRRHAPRCRFLLLSSAAVYGNPTSLPVTEQHDVKPLSPYGYHKRQAELLCEEFSRIYGLPTACARIFSAYGPGLRRQVVWDICERVLTSGQLALRGTGAESRDFIHAADIAHGLYLLATEAPCVGEIYNLASGREVTVAELATTLLASLNSKVKPGFDGRATPGDPLHWKADISKIAALGFSPAIPLEEGLRTVATWCAAELSPL
jgi:UDP-glucose 4-epimerase